ncbi:MAG: radical SAM protein [Dehalococcoidales bacterium]|nr:radical SAM protein [Dehalococcoidales bacterium]
MEPDYITLYRSGELERRAHTLEGRLACCDICPRDCHVNRLEDETGYCHSGRLPIVASVCSHHGEEPAISGSRGSGTVFFGNCNMRCVYCQNYQISQNWQKQKSKQVDCHTLAGSLLYLQDELGCHNINFVSPSHFIPQLVRAVLEAVPQGLRVPLVYNTGGYDSVSALKELDGIISIYLPDLRYASDDRARKFSHAADYVARARQAIKEMHRQVGSLQVDESGVAQRGLIVRHLILPNGLAGSEETFRWLAQELSPGVTVSLMSQYLPLHKAQRVPLLSRTVSASEYETALQLLLDAGIENGWTQEMGASENYLPDFEREGHPFLTAHET